jgi:hypothetical protein
MKTCGVFFNRIQGGLDISEVPPCAKDLSPSSYMLFAGIPALLGKLFHDFENKGDVAGGRSCFHIPYIDNIDETNFMCCFYGPKTGFVSITEE